MFYINLNPGKLSEFGCIWFIKKPKINYNTYCLWNSFGKLQYTKQINIQMIDNCHKSNKKSFCKYINHCPYIKINIILILNLYSKITIH